jgi:hypothetical protein
MRTELPLLFRISFVRPWLLALALMAVPLVVLAVSGAVVASALALGVCSVAALVPIALAVRSSTWDVDADGIGGRDNWHVYRRVCWADIASVSLRAIPGYRYAWVHSRDRRRAFWLPLFLTDMDGFCEAVARFAEPDNLLRCFLDEHA